MGAGRTALVSSLFGAARSRVTGTRRASAGGPARGPFRSPAEAIAAGLALVSEDRKRYGLVLEASIAENMTLATLRRFARRVLLDHGARDATRRRRSSTRCASKAPGAATRSSNQLSGGNQQKVVLGKWLHGAARACCFLDEPTRGIDVGAKAEIYQLIARAGRARAGRGARLLRPAGAAGA